MQSLGRRNFLKLSSLAAASLLTGCATQKPSKPNFLFFLIDDLGWSDLGCYGSTFYETPNIDKLASEGMLFTDGYAACPVCSPTRASVMTGKYPARINLTDFIWNANKDQLLPAHYENHMALEEVTIAEALKESGYNTYFIGKWHLGEEDYYPEKQGFDVNIAGYHAGLPPTYFHPYKKEEWKHWNYQVQNLDLTIGKNGDYLTDRLADESIHILDNVGNNPFLLYFSHYAVHTPLEAKEKITKKYEEKAAMLPKSKGPRYIDEDYQFHKNGHIQKIRQVQDHAVYAAMIESVDESVGRVMKKLEEKGLADNTVVIFMSDNGGLSATSEGSPTSNLPLRAGKGWMYEGGIREPYIIKWPGQTKPGSKCSFPVTSTDFYPTMLEMAGLPQKTKQHQDGKSLIPLLKGKKEIDRDAIYWHYPHYSNQGGKPGGAVRKGDWKLIEWYENNRLELYNLKEDIGEQNNLIKKYPDKAKKLQALLHQWRIEVDAQMPKPNPDYKPN